MYMTVSSGIAMEIHYCMGEKAGVDFYDHSGDNCGRCGMKEENKKGCCNDEHKFLKLDDSHQKAVNAYNFNVGGIALPIHYPLYAVTLPPAEVLHSVNNHSPPPYFRPPARIFHGVFRI
jgi:hypothetical protein